MFSLSGYDGEAVGFDSVSTTANPRATSSAQTTEYEQRDAAAQTGRARDVGCTARPADDAGAAVEPEPPGLADFLHRVAPLVLQQLDRGDADFLDPSSDSDEEETPTARLLQEIPGPERAGAGDDARAVLSLSWSGGGTSLAASRGHLVHDAWCRGPGGVKVFAPGRGAAALAPQLEIPERSCVTALRYHPAGAALLAYGTAAGDVVVCELGEGGARPLPTPPPRHAARRVAALHWADAAVANSLLLMHVKNKAIRRGAADQVLVSGGAAGTVNAWRVNAARDVFELITGYRAGSARGRDAPDITCLDFARAAPGGEGALFVAGTSTGRLLVCHAVEEEDPARSELAGPAACVLDVAFAPHRPAIFVALSMDSELRVYDVNRESPLKVVSAEACVSCVRWVWGWWVVVGLAGGAESLRVYSVADGRALPVAGLGPRADVTLRIAAGDKEGNIRVWELPPLRNKFNCENWV
ncbi:uncharacterized protein LOC121725507 [Aricia agestis]|uniref:uncharacterized protein LOC121725507 n=1 Tax=Aricia agestis TaxID=91739 RepID=UPI001C203685|nr:uncharacterized protein LOC121725507 [Aricia agestis]